MRDSVLRMREDRDVHLLLPEVSGSEALKDEWGGGAVRVPATEISAAAQSPLLCGLPWALCAPGARAQEPPGWLLPSQQHGPG